MPPRIAKPAALAVGVLLILLCIAGFAERWTTGRNDVVPTDLWQDLGHLAIGAYLVVMSIQGEAASASALGISAFLCAAFAGLSLYQLGGSSQALLFERTVWVSKTSCWLHLALAAAQSGAAGMNTSKRQLFYK